MWTTRPAQQIPSFARYFSFFILPNSLVFFLKLLTWSETLRTHKYNLS